jgi:hypothetical protein
VRIDGADKKSRTKGYLKIGIVGSHQLAIRFPDNDALGFALGKRTRTTVLDIDTDCERTRDDACGRHWRAGDRGPHAPRSLAGLVSPQWRGPPHPTVARATDRPAWADPHSAPFLAGWRLSDAP